MTLHELQDELEEGSRQKDILHKKVVDHQATWKTLTGDAKAEEKTQWDEVVNLLREQRKRNKEVEKRLEKMA
jgi:hypothetical protein